jgi:conjugal transfer pilus assembly protein TraB
MREDQNPSSNNVKYKQNRNLFIVVSIFTASLLGLYWLMCTHVPEKSEQKKMESLSFANPTDHIDAQAVWMERAQNELKEERAKTSELKKTVENLQSNENQKSVESNPQYQSLKTQIQALQKVVEAQSEKNSQTQLAGASAYQGQVFGTTPGAQAGQIVQNQNVVPQNLAAGIDNDVINLKPVAGAELPIKNSDTYVSAGTFAKAIMLGAADASAGVNSQSKPVPMLFRIIADGTLPNHKKSHLKNCVAIGAVTGDISSERGEIRIERLSCTFPNGEIVEQVVEGTIFGMDAKNGVRGNPVWREGALLGRAAIAGSLSGFAKGVSQSYTTNSVSPLGITQSVDNGAIFKNGLASGASSAMEKLADYNISRAEQYHPVIQISAGQPVDVVFLRGFYLDGKKHEDIDQENHSQPELFPSATVASSPAVSGLTLSERQLEKIKQHESAFITRSQGTGEMQ